MHGPRDIQMMIYRTELWAFDEHNQELLYHDGQIRQLPSRHSRCLKVLLDAAGSTVPHETLLQDVWGTTFKDASTVSAVISELRKLIGCGQDGRRIIVSVPKRGYRLTGLPFEKIVVATHGAETRSIVTDPAHPAVSQSDAADPSVKASALPLQASVSEPKAPPRNQGRYWLWLGLTLLVLVALLAGYRWFRSFALPQLGEQRVLTFEPGVETDFDVSQDGNMLAYVSPHQNKQLGFLKNLATGSIEKLPGDFVTSPTFSPDQRFLVMRMHDSGRCQLVRVRLNKAPLKAETIADCGVHYNWSTLAFSQDQQTLFFSRRNQKHGPAQLVRLELQSGYQRNLTSPPANGAGDYAFVLSPDGTQLVFIRDRGWQQSSIWQLDLQSGETRQLYQSDVMLHRLSWLDAQHLLLSDEVNTAYSLSLTDLKLTPVLTENSHLHQVIARNNQLYFARGRLFVTTIWQLDLASGELTAVTEGQYQDRSPTVAANGQLYFLSDRSANRTIWRQHHNQLQAVFSPPNCTNITNLRATVQGDLLFLCNKQLQRFHQGQTSPLLPASVVVNDFDIDDAGSSVLYSHEQQESWSLSRLDLATGLSTPLQINGITPQLHQGNLFFTKLRQAGLWQREGSETRLVLAEFNGNLGWKIVGDSVVSINDSNETELLIYDLNQPLAPPKIIQLPGRGYSLSCLHDRCYLDVKQAGNSEIVQASFRR